MKQITKETLVLITVTADEAWAIACRVKSEPAQELCKRVLNAIQINYPLNDSDGAEVRCVQALAALYAKIHIFAQALITDTIRPSADQRHLAFYLKSIAAAIAHAKENIEN